MYRGGRSEGSSASPMPRLPRPSQAYVRLRKRTMLRTRGSSSNVVAVTAAPGTTVAAAPAGKEASARSEETRKGTTARSPAEPAISKTGNGTLAPAPAGGSAASPLDRNAFASMGAALDFIVSPEPVIGKGSVAGKASVEESLEPWRVVETPPPPPISSTDALPRATVVSPELVQEALEEGAYMLPRRRWDQPSDAPLLRGPAYLEDGKKVPAVGGPLCTLFAAQCFELLGDHVAGATALLLQKGDLVPPREAKFVFTIYFACPRPSRGQPYIALLLHFYSKTSVEDVPAASGDLLRELWSGNAENAISRFKVLAALRSGPHLVRAVLAWLGLDDTRPMLLCRQVHASLNRATLPHLNGGRGASSGGMPSHYDHVEIAFDLAASPLCNQIMRYAWPSVRCRIRPSAFSPTHLPPRSRT